MEVVDRRQNRLRFGHVAIVTRTFLPEAECEGVRPLSHRQLLQKGTSKSGEMAFDSDGEGPLDLGKQTGDP